MVAEWIGSHCCSGFLALDGDEQHNDKTSTGHNSILLIKGSLSVLWIVHDFSFVKMFWQNFFTRSPRETHQRTIRMQEFPIFFFFFFKSNSKKALLALVSYIASPIWHQNTFPVLFCLYFFTHYSHFLLLSSFRNGFFPSTSCPSALHFLSFLDMVANETSTWHVLLSSGVSWGQSRTEITKAGQFNVFVLLRSGTFWPLTFLSVNVGGSAGWFSRLTFWMNV